MKIVIAAEIKNANNGIAVPKAFSESISNIKDTEFHKRDQKKQRSIVDFINPLTQLNEIKDLLNFAIGENELKVIPFSSAEHNQIIKSIVENSITVTKSVIQNHKVSHDNSIFRGMFSNKKQFSAMLEFLPSDDCQIIVSDIHSLSQITGNENIDVGIYLLCENGKLVKLQNYSNLLWRDLKFGILKTFANLNAKRITINDITDHSIDGKISLGEKILEIAPEIGLNLSKKEDFSFDTELNGIFDIEGAIETVSILKEYPELYAIAMHIIKNPNSGKKIDSNITLDVSFGVNVRLLSIFQGSFAGGYTRKFSVSIAFNESQK